jgi:rod shape-determining protein MreB
LRVAGDKLDQAIADYIKEKHNLAVGEQTSEEIKMKIGTAVIEKDPKNLEIRGRDLVLGLPKTIKITSNEICTAMMKPNERNYSMHQNVLRETPQNYQPT